MGNKAKGKSSKSSRTKANLFIISQYIWTRNLNCSIREPSVVILWPHKVGYLWLSPPVLRSKESIRHLSISQMISEGGCCLLSRFIERRCHRLPGEASHKEFMPVTEERPCLHDAQLCSTVWGSNLSVKRNSYSMKSHLYLALFWMQSLWRSQIAITQTLQGKDSLVTFYLE